MTLSAILSDVRSVHNVGSIFRTADGAGCAKLYLCGITPTPLDRFGKVRPDFAKVSLGAERDVAWEHAEDIDRLVERLKGEGWEIVALEQSERSIPLTSLCSRVLKNMSLQRVALIVGNEVGGIPENILTSADVILEIPMRGGKESLNVAVAFGIAAYALRSVGDDVS
jgi:tRNA G18 (ribose-2'-O)-methylase SpoU